MEETSRRGILWVDIDLAIRKGLTFYQTRSNAIILQGILPAYCIPKNVRLKTGEVLYEKHTCHLDFHQRSHYVTIGLKNWARKLFNNQKEKLFDNQKEKLLDKPEFFQSTQPTPNPIRDTSGRPDITHDVISVQDERKTSRSQEISVNSLSEERSSSDRTGRLVNTEEIQARSSEETKSLNVEQTHDKTGRPVKDTVAVQADPEVYHEAETLNIDDKTLSERIEADMASKFQDYHIPL